MYFKPSSLEIYISNLPEELQRLALEAIIEEQKRWDRGDLTPEERESLEMCRNFGESARKTVDKILMDILKG